ncbi:hypothetical protein GMORB2_7552 [Geosmithia morbida]|uniref:Uncharacterized protein n=1 Tax=Geosmithia morbida TaxID=1094350 RepID=A0A9P4YUD6_9HYPO|nr:uncharacterized protein GMORB2_7552 [Geosmithia morbida]KAF4121959.1 hypothetical protein GMORB2_7552 [Geosmithia morbida]
MSSYFMCWHILPKILSALARPTEALSVSGTWVVLGLRTASIFQRTAGHILRSDVRLREESEGLCIFDSHVGTLSSAGCHCVHRVAGEDCAFQAPGSMRTYILHCPGLQLLGNAAERPCQCHASCPQRRLRACLYS